jgi:hypothetical protein
MAETWPFEDVPNTICLTLWRFIREKQPILFVTRDDDGMFQFLDGKPMTMADAALVALSEILKVDATLREIADLPIGWEATREKIGSSWSRVKPKP